MSKLVQLGLNLIGLDLSKLPKLIKIGLDLSKIEFIYKFCSMELKILKPRDFD